ncbi:MAG: SIMPL domain-containing protein [Bacillota bacterium]
MAEVFSAKNKIISAILLVLAASLVIVAIGLVFNVPAQAEENKVEKKTINVTGQAKVTASPDIARINLGVVTEDADAKAAQRKNAESMDKVIAAIKAAGVKDEDIRTIGYSISPKYDYIKETGMSNIVGYTVSNSVNVTVRDISKTGAIIDAATDSGVNASSSISFELSNYEQHYNEALKNAVLAAKKKAGTVADALGVKLKGPVTVSESGGYSPLKNYVTYDMAMAPEMAATPIQAGTLEITATVSIMYEY